MGITDMTSTNIPPRLLDLLAKNSKIEKMPENPKMTKSVQVWYDGKLHDIVSDEEAKKLIQNGNAVQIAENMIKVTPRWW